MKDSHSHQQHHPTGHEGHHPPAPATEPPVKPGYPEHPEVPHEAGHLPAGNQTPAQGAHGGHDVHGAHGGGHDKHEGHSVEAFRSKFWISLVLTIPTIIWGHMLPRLTGYMAPTFPGSEWIAPVLGTAVFV